MSIGGNAPAGSAIPFTMCVTAIAVGAISPAVFMAPATTVTEAPANAAKHPQTPANAEKTHHGILMIALPLFSAEHLLLLILCLLWRHAPNLRHWT